MRLGALRLLTTTLALQRLPSASPPHLRAAITYTTRAIHSNSFRSTHLNSALAETPSSTVVHSRDYSDMYHYSSDPYERLLQGMLPFHNSFRQKHAVLMQRLPATPIMSKNELLSYFTIGLSLTQHLEGHHQIEERYIFPLLEKKLPQFGKEHLQEHATMHEAVEALDKYCSVAAKKVKNHGKKDEGQKWPKDVYDMDKMEGILRHLQDTLFVHLQHEEASLKSQSLRDAGFTPEELERIPM